MSRSHWPELVFAGEHDAAVISRAVRRGTLKRLARGVYSGAIDQDDRTIVRAGIWRIVGRMFPGCVVVDESSMIADPLDLEQLRIAHGKRGALTLPGVVIAPRAGAIGLAGDLPLAPGVWMGSPARTLLDYFARAPQQRPDALFADWFHRQRQRESLGTLKQLVAQLRRLAPAVRRGKALAEALAYVSGQLAARPLSEPAPVAERPAASPVTLPVLGSLAQTLGMALLAGATTRPELSQRLGLSKPTVSAGIDELLGVHLVRPLFLQPQAKGRAAKVYGIAKSAGWVLGIDIGNYQALFIARGLEGDILAQRRITNASFQQLIGGAAALLQTLQQELRAYGPLYAATLALSQAIRQDICLSGREGPSQAGLTPDEIIARLRFAGPARLTLENNVNCAVAAEALGGAAKGLRDVIFLQVGTHIGAGIIAGGQLIRGVRGCAGEVADIPFPWSRTEQPVELMMERHLGYPDYLHRHHPAPAAAGRDARRLPELLARADAGEPAAQRIIQEYGKQVGYLAMGLVAMLDPAMLVLGGPVGGHRMICAAVRKQVQLLSAHTEVAASLHGDAATAQGAVALAQDRVLRRLFGAQYHSKIQLVPATPRE